MTRNVCIALTALCLAGTPVVLAAGQRPVSKAPRVAPSAVKGQKPVHAATPATPKTAKAPKSDKAHGKPHHAGRNASEPNAISERIERNPQLRERVQAMLPEGMTIEQASSGFKNQGQFLAALNVSREAGIPFAQLQKAMTVDGLSLGQAVQRLKPGSTLSAKTTGTEN